MARCAKVGRTRQEGKTGKEKGRLEGARESGRAAAAEKKAGAALGQGGTRALQNEVKDATGAQRGAQGDGKRSKKARDGKQAKWQEMEK